MRSSKLTPRIFLTRQKTEKLQWDSIFSPPNRLTASPSRRECSASSRNQKSTSSRACGWVRNFSLSQAVR